MIDEHFPDLLQILIWIFIYFLNFFIPPFSFLCVLMCFSQIFNITNFLK